MRTIELDYEVKTAYGDWMPYVLVTSDGKEYERAVNIIHQNPDSYRVVKVQHIR
jgi:threonyl-tRNA synthetase